MGFSQFPSSSIISWEEDSFAFAPCAPAYNAKALIVKLYQQQMYVRGQDLAYILQDDFDIENLKQTETYNGCLGGC